VGVRFVEVELCGASRGGKGKTWAFHPLPCFLLQLDAPVRDVGLPIAAWRKTTVLGPVASPACSNNLVPGSSLVLGRLD
jgi:hypothetical protein